MTLIMRLVRAEMLEVLRTDYIRFARARGLTTRAIHFGHALKNTLVPVITIAGLQFGSVIAFSIITETVFQWPGMGLLFVQAVQNVDIPIMAAYLLLVALIFVTINLVVDILYTVVDPRLRSTTGGRREQIRMTDAVVPHTPNRTRPRAASAAGALQRARRQRPVRFFRRSKTAMVAATVTVLFFLARDLRLAPVAAEPLRPGAARPDQLRSRRSGRRTARRRSCSAPTTRAATCSRRSSTACASR